MPGRLFQIPQASRARAKRLADRYPAWPECVRPMNPSEFCQAAAPVVLPLMFETAAAEPEIVPGYRHYVLFHRDLPPVRLSAKNWLWVALDGSTGDRGLISLWSWRFDVDLNDAMTAISVLTQEAGRARNAR